MGRNSYFAFKQFRVEQAHCGMKITTDACLFGARIDVENTHRILDIGTGTGLLSLMAAQRTGALIDALEIEPNAQKQAHENFIASPWYQQLNLHPVSAQNFQSRYNKKYDCIVCNPPFFTDVTRCPDNQRRLARHDDQLPLNVLFRILKQHLHDKGSSWILLPKDADENACTIAREAGLALTRRIALASSKDDTPHRSILVFSHYTTVAAERVVAEERLNIYHQHPQYTAEFINLLAPYYLYL